jgi:hypothetical protein
MGNGTLDLQQKLQKKKMRQWAERTEFRLMLFVQREWLILRDACEYSPMALEWVA